MTLEQYREGISLVISALKEVEADADTIEVIDMHLRRVLRTIEGDGLKLRRNNGD